MEEVEGEKCEYAAVNGVDAPVRMRDGIAGNDCDNLSDNHENPCIKQFDAPGITLIGAFSEADQSCEQEVKSDDQRVRGMEEEQDEQYEKESAVREGEVEFLKRALRSELVD